MTTQLRKLLRGFFTQVHVVHALILRETRTRFGKHRLGYLWAFMEPLTLITTFVIIFEVGNRNLPSGMDDIGFLATGLLPYILFRSIVGKTQTAIQANKALLYYPQIRPLDLIISRTILESATLIAIFSLILLINTIYMRHLPLDNALKFISALFLATLLGASFGLVVSSLTSMFQSLEQLIGPMLRPLLWISGMFFTAKELPSSTRNILMWNPLLHMTELTRDGWFRGYSTPYYSYHYIIYWILALAFLGLTLERVTRRKLEA